MDSSLTPNLEESELSLTPNLEHAERISRSMRALSYEEAKEGVSRYIEEPLQEKGGLTSWDLWFQREIRRNIRTPNFLFCWYDTGVWSCFLVRPIIIRHLGGATRRQGARTRPLYNLSRGSGEKQGSNLICFSFRGPTSAIDISKACANRYCSRPTNTRDRSERRVSGFFQSRQ